MTNTKKIGIWMDHSAAEIVDPNTENIGRTIQSNFTTETKEDALQKGEHLMHNKEQQMNEAFYKEIASEILKYDKVLLFGPTNAKTELHNYLSNDLHFKDIKIEVEAADKMSDNEKQAFVRDHYSK